MFGDKMLIGQYEVTVSKNSRIVMPSKTNCEENDHLILIYDDILDCYSIYSKITFEEKFKNLDNMVFSAKTEREFRLRKLIFYNFCKNMLCECIVDKQRRINLKSNFMPAEKLLLIGANDHLILERKK